MKAQMVKRVFKLQEWATQIADCKKSGQSVREWCCKNGINVKTFYNRMKVVREEMLELVQTVNADIISSSSTLLEGKPVAGYQQPRNIRTDKYIGGSKEPEFVELTMPKPKQAAAITVHMGAYAIDIQNDADGAAVEQVLVTVSRL
jgi:hypothetical protein